MPTDSLMWLAQDKIQSRPMKVSLIYSSIEYLGANHSLVFSDDQQT
ncbi:MAG: hypothetical protein ACI8ZV_001759, partial [Chitinophagales bacterium]